jgi:hypothetical protein
MTNLSAAERPWKRILLLFRAVTRRKLLWAEALEVAKFAIFRKHLD